MEKHLEKEYEQLANVNNITISDTTRRIIGGIAAAGDIYGFAADYADEQYSKDIDDIISGFTDAWLSYNKKLEELLAEVITGTLSGSRFKEM